MLIVPVLTDILSIAIGRPADAGEVWHRIRLKPPPQGWPGE